MQLLQSMLLKPSRLLAMLPLQQRMLWILSVIPLMKHNGDREHGIGCTTRYAREGVSSCTSHIAYCSRLQAMPPRN